MIEDYVKNTHASTHNQYKMKVMDVFAVNKDRENIQFNDVGNRYVGVLMKSILCINDI